MSRRHLLLAVFLCIVVGSSKAQSTRPQPPATLDTLRITFAFNSHTLSPGDSSLLITFIQSHHADSNLFIIGQTDTLGSRHYNHHLALQRANAVAAVAKVPHPHLIIQGESGPRQSPDSLNRTATLIASPKILPPVPVRQEVPRYSPTPQQAPISQPSAPIPAPQQSPITPSPIDTIITLDNIYFVADQATLTSSSRLALPSYIPYLLPYKNRHIEVRGHCNYIGDPISPDHPLYQLSVKRARIIYDYLIQSGLDPNNVTYTGVGNHEPKYPHPITREQMERNMRVEIIIYRM